MIWRLILSLVKRYILSNPRTTIPGILGIILAQVPALAPYKEHILEAAVALVAIFAGDATPTPVSLATDAPSSAHEGP